MQTGIFQALFNRATLYGTGLLGKYRPCLKIKTPDNEISGVQCSETRD